MRLPIMSIVTATAVLSAGQVLAEPRFEGVAMVTGFTGTCADYDPTGSTFVARYRPAGVGDNPSNSGLSLFFPAGAYNYVPTGKFTGSFKPVVNTVIFDFAGTPPGSKVRFTSQEPATVTATTPFIQIKSEITNFDEMPGCVARSNIAVTLRP